MKPAPFAYTAPDSLPAALDILAKNGYDARILAGGQSLVPALNFRLAQPGLLLDINRLPGLDFVRREASGELRLGALLRQRRLERDPLVAEAAPLLHEAIPTIAHPQIRNRGTLGGSLAHADPAAELPVVMVALAARFRLQKAKGERWVAAEAFFLGLFATGLEPEEMLVEVAIPPMPPRTGWAFMELARRSGDYAQAGVAAIVTVDEDRVCRSARLVYLNAGDTPVVAQQATQMLVGQAASVEVFAAVAHHAAQHEITPTADVHASAAYKRHLAAVLTRRALRLAFQRASGRDE